MSYLIGRRYERDQLKRVKLSDKPELVAIYGRRRVGKTFLIREYFKRDMVFEITGLFKGNMADQLQNFAKVLGSFSRKALKQNPESWLEAFTLLERYLDKRKGRKKKVVFIDEFPWMATPRSKFVMAFESFWNQYCSKRNDLIVVICGSAASYMVKNIIRNRGGLHNRITQKIRLLPFNLLEVQQFLEKHGIAYTHYDILQLYMVMGGVPHYLEKLEKGKSVAQNIDALCFEKDGVLANEFNELYASLFENSTKHLKVIEALAQCNKGITRQQIIDQTGIPSGGDFTLKLQELIESGFVSEYPYYQNKKQLSLYRLSDEYSKFYLKFIAPNKHNGSGTWQRLHNKSAFTTWAGFAFETICLKFVHQLKKALRIDAIYSTNSAWFNENAQIDLLIDRDDNVMNLCEMKFHNAPFSLDKGQYLNLKNKIAELKKDTGTRKNVFVVLVSTYGIKDNAYSNEVVHNSLEISALFE